MSFKLPISLVKEQSDHALPYLCLEFPWKLQSQTSRRLTAGTPYTRVFRKDQPLFQTWIMLGRLKNDTKPPHNTLNCRMYRRPRNTHTFPVTRATDSPSGSCHRTTSRQDQQNQLGSSTEPFSTWKKGRHKHHVKTHVDEAICQGSSVCCYNTKTSAADSQVLFQHLLQTSDLEM